MWSEGLKIEKSAEEIKYRSTELKDWWENIKTVAD
jgi:hypothetical protein